MLIVEDGNARLWRIWPSGAAREVDDVEYDLVLALEPSPVLRIEHLQNREPFEILRFVTCPECEGKGEIEQYALCAWEDGDRRDEPGGTYVVQWLDGLWDSGVDGLSRGQSIELRDRDCQNEECHGGIVLDHSGIYVHRHELLGRVAA
jgi:hypothetical protein